MYNLKGGENMPQIVFVDTPNFQISKKVSKTPMPTMHHHVAFEIFYIIKGEREYFIEDEFFKLEEGDLAVIPANILHRTDGKGASRYLIYFSYDYMKRYLTDEMISALSIHRPFVFRSDEGEGTRNYLSSLFDCAYREYMKLDDEAEAERDARIAIYLQQILLIITGANNKYKPREYADRRIEEVVRYINENYSSINNIEEIAAKFYMSRYHLCHLFTQNLGVGLISYLNTIKIRRACELLEDKAQSITEIATKCGFNSSSYFCKVFKEEKGMSPSEYRKRRGGWN